MPLTERVVIKVGGATLFQYSGFESELRSLLAKYANAQVWMLVGGGDLIDAVRTVHKIYPVLDPVQIHWRCVELLDHTWELAKEIFPTDTPIASREDLNRFVTIRDRSGVHWVRCQSFYSRLTRDLIPDSWCPESTWNTTSDVLAWLLAKLIDADRVVLLKQCHCDPAWSLAEAANRGVIDSELARLVKRNGATRPNVEFAKMRDECGTL